MEHIFWPHRQLLSMLLSKNWVKPNSNNTGPLTLSLFLNCLHYIRGKTCTSVAIFYSKFYQINHSGTHIYMNPFLLVSVFLILAASPTASGAYPSCNHYIAQCANCTKKITSTKRIFCIKLRHSVGGYHPCQKSWCQA